MNFKQLLIYGIILVIISSLTINYDQIQSLSQEQDNSIEKIETKQLSSSEFTSSTDIGKSGRLRPLSILVYTEFIDNISSSHNEFENTIASISETYGSDYIYQNLTDYRNLSAELPNFDILLIPEQESIISMDNMSTVGAYWSDTLADYVSSGGIVIGLDYGKPIPGFASTATLMNASNLLSINGIVVYGSGFTVDLVNATDALSYGLAGSWAGASGTLVYDMDLSDCTSVVEKDGDPVVVHKIQDKGHVVLLGFDMYNRIPEYDTLLANAIRLHRHVVFDLSHSPNYSVASQFANFATDLVTEGFAVTVMNSFSSTLIESTEILIISFGTAFYTENEATLIENYVQNGGGLFVLSNWGQYGEELDPIINRFGYLRNNESYIIETNDNLVSDCYNLYDGDNIGIHSITHKVSYVETDKSGALIEVPDNAEILVKTDDDGTAKWSADGTDAINITIAAASTYGNGRVSVITDCNFVNCLIDSDSDAITNYLENQNFFLNNIRWLSAAGIKEQVVLFDQSHSPYANINIHLNLLATYLTLNGFTVKWMNDFNENLFLSASVLVIIGSSTDYSVSEKQIIKNFVRKGGNTLLLGDITTFGESVKDLCYEFDYTMQTPYLVDTDDFVNGIWHINFEDDNLHSDHPIMEGISRLEIYAGSALTDIGTASYLISTDDDGTSQWSNGTDASNYGVAIADEYEEGRIVVLSDFSIFDSLSDTDSDGDVNFLDSDNNLFALNIFKWLTVERDPYIEIIEPNGGNSYTTHINTTWYGHDPNGDNLLYDVLYSYDGTTWETLLTDYNKSYYLWNTSDLVDNEYLLKVIAKSQLSSTEDISDTFFIIDNGGPVFEYIGHTPNSPLTTDMIKINADITDISGVSGVTCYYQVNNGSWQSVPMILSTGSAYSVGLGSYSANDKVYYYIEATDNSIHNFVSTSDIQLVKVTGSLIPGVPNEYLFIIGAIVAILVVILFIRKKRG